MEHLAFNLHMNFTMKSYLQCLVSYPIIFFISKCFSLQN